VWDATTGTELVTLSGHADSVSGVAFSPEGTRLATASFDGTAQVYAFSIDMLLKLGYARLTRWFTTEECQKYLQMQQCPPEP
jgi:WD40 repeat protein